MNTEKKLIEVMEEFSTAMLVTQCADSDSLAARPLAIAELEENGTMWFITSRTSGKLNDVSQHENVAVTFQSRNQFVSISGRARRIDNRARVEQIWNEAWRIWFPQGVDDPSLTLLRVDPETGEYWDESGLQGLKMKIKKGIAYLQSERPTSSDQENARVKLS